MRALFLIPLAVLMGCENPEEYERERQQSVMKSGQRTLTDAPIVCRDGVQFYVTTGSHGEYNFIHRQYPDGTNYRCVKRTVETKVSEVPVE